jgi:hypothetical protein
MKHLIIFLLVANVLACSPSSNVQEEKSAWPGITSETRPWTRWWWHGNAVTKEGITAEMEAYQRAGIGGLEITPIYGVYGSEETFVDYLSPEWMELLAHVFKEAGRLGMGIDMATGTGWPFGGPWVSNDDACKNLRYKIYEVKGGARLDEKIEFIQEPYLRLVGNQIYEVNENAEREGRKLLGSRKEPALVKNTKDIRITDLVDPVAENKNLQTLAIDQVQFEKPLPLVALVAYNDDNQSEDLTAKVDASGNLDWMVPEGNWKLYAVFEGYHGKMVERAGPGGEGNVIDHFSPDALANYLERFDEAFEGHDVSSLRAFFNDSYEVDDARGSADFTPALFEEFKKRRGYDLRNELPALFGHAEAEKNRRVLCDYRETLSELLLDNFTRPWKEWANSKGAIVRNQAHGSPANILDLYAVVDIPEIEGTEPLRFKMATSSGNVSGKKLISAEAATWLNEHFQSSLSDIKAAMDLFMLHGVNHLVYHGTCYSPPGEPWPGRLSYAAVHMNPRNPMWKDADALNAYITRCQSFLQRGSPHNDVLLYYPVYDPFSTPGPEMVEHFDGIGRAFDGTSFAACAEEMLQRGYAFDYISDRQISKTAMENGLLKTPGGNLYQTIVIPRVAFMPLETLEKLSSLANQGASIVFVDDMPGAVSGYANVEEKTGRFNEIVGGLKAQIANGESTKEPSIQSGDNLDVLLANSGVRRETMVDAGIHCIRRKNGEGRFVYLVRNMKGEAFEGWLPISIATKAVMLYDPMAGTYGKARINSSASATSVFVQIAPEQTLILETAPDLEDTPEFEYSEINGDPVSLDQKWSVSFDSGGPALPDAFDIDTPRYWTDLDNPSYQNFSGTATYRTTFGKPGKQSARWLLKIGSVKETAEVFLNGKPLATLIGPEYQIAFDDSRLEEENVLEIRVSNLMANRIAWMDRNQIFWKKFYNVNFPSRLRENSKNNLFDASHWKPAPSGLAGKVEIYPLK